MNLQEVEQFLQKQQNTLKNKRQQRTRRAQQALLWFTYCLQP